MARPLPLSSGDVLESDTEFDTRIAELERLKCAIIADISLAKPIRLQAASLGEPDWPAMQLIVALARLAGALNLRFELVDAPLELIPRMDDAGIDWRTLNLKLVDGDTIPLAEQNALPIL